MSDCPKSTSPPPKADNREYVFRHTFLWRLESAEHREMFHQLGDLLLTVTNEGGQWGPRDDRRSLQLQEIEAALLDVEGIGAALQEVANEPTHSEVARQSLALCVMAGDWALAVSDLAHEIRRRLREFEGGPEPISQRGLGAELREAERIAHRLADHHPDPEVRRIYQQIAEREARKGRGS